MGNSVIEMTTLAPVFEAHHRVLISASSELGDARDEWVLSAESGFSIISQGMCEPHDGGSVAGKRLTRCESSGKWANVRQALQVKIGLSVRVRHTQNVGPFALSGRP